MATRSSSGGAGAAARAWLVLALLSATIYYPADAQLSAFVERLTQSASASLTVDKGPLKRVATAGVDESSSVSFGLLPPFTPPVAASFSVANRAAVPGFRLTNAGLATTFGKRKLLMNSARSGSGDDGSWDGSVVGDDSGVAAATAVLAG